ncbi:hypothetical protein K2173_001253 [Erythroxylum novogranatense]|uniref:Uncharacterized protein n=1 Tax=Erythroxylum novogranatense TaxID=1862640 RepID=A0AAV8T374_9ROSI|nr:hypothetical protein K2173_001253 [Erythroxylum novogranatense]
MKKTTKAIKELIKPTHLPKPSTMAENPSLHSLDPVSLILAQNSHQPLALKLMTESYITERGPRYKAYAELRESKLRMKSLRLQEEEECKIIKQTPPKKQVKFQENLTNSRKGSSFLAQSVPDFSATLRKENRKPPLELTPPSKNSSKVKGILSNSRGSKSANTGEKKNVNGGLIARKSYATIQELKGLCTSASNAINGEDRRGRGGKTVLGYRQF